MAISTIPQSIGQEGQAPTVQPEQPRGLTVRERFDALTPRQRDEILDKHRYWDVDHVDWWDGVYGCFKADMEAIGIEVDQIYFSGFCSQGDGACFEGSVRDWPKFLTSINYTDAALISHADHSFSFSVKHSGRYYHENCTSFSADLPLPEDADDEWFIEGYAPYPQDSLHCAVWMANLTGLDAEHMEEAFQEAFKSHMRDLYGRLDEEHDYLTSDEAILESLECNDYLEEAINSIIPINEESPEEEHA